MLDESRLLVIPIGDFAEIARNYDDASWRKFELPSTILDRHSFAAAVKAELPLDPPLARGMNWDAITDSVFGGLILLKDERVAITWPDASIMRVAFPREFRYASRSLGAAAALASREVVARTSPLDVRVLIGI